MNYTPYSISIFEDDVGNSCFMVIDTLVKGISAGGIRINESVTLEEVKELAREMTYKFALFDIEMGGAKMGIRLKEGNSKEVAILNFRKNIQPFIKRLNYIPGADLGSDQSDINLLCKKIWWIRRESNTAYFTAIGIKACLDFIAKQYNLSAMRVALSGFGKVGYFLMKEFIKLNIKLVAVSDREGCILSDSGLDKQKLLVLKEEYPNEWIFRCGLKILPREALYTVPCDILIPGAEAYAINPQNAERLNTKFICPVANATYHQDIISRLSEKGIIFFPDFVTNAAGVLGSYFYSWGCSLDEAGNNIRAKMFSMLSHIYKNSGNNYYGYALEVAKKKIERRNESEGRYKNSFLSALKTKLFLAGYIPAWLLKRYTKFSEK